MSYILKDWAKHLIRRFDRDTVKRVADTEFGDAQFSVVANAWYWEKIEATVVYEMDVMWDVFYNDQRQFFEDYLVEECWYSRLVAEESDDWIDKWMKENAYEVLPKEFTDIYYNDKELEEIYAEECKNWDAETENKARYE